MRKLVIAFFLLLPWLYIQSQDNAFIFSNLTEDDGLSYNVVNCFLKDSRDILWIGTYNGFSRYDGSNFYNYKIRKGKNSLTSEVIHSLCEDRNGNLWGSTDNGVFCYKPVADSFINYKISSLGKDPTCYEILCDKKGDIWAAGLWSLFRLNRPGNFFEEIVKLSDAKYTNNYFRIIKNGFLEDPSGSGFWMATSNGLVQYNKNTGAITDSRTNPNDSLFKQRGTAALTITPSGNIWFFNKGMNEITSFNPVTKKILKQISLNEKLPNGEVVTLFEDRNNRLWASTWDYHLFVVDLNHNNTITQIFHKPEDKKSVGSSFMWDVYEDDDNTIWLGTLAGVSRCNPEKNIYKPYLLHEQLAELKNNSISIIEEDPANKSLWLVTDNALLINYELSTKKKTVYDLSKATPGKDGSKPGYVKAIRFYKDYILIPTSAGAWQLKRGSSKITPFTLLPASYKDFKCAEIILSGDSAAYFSNGAELLYWNRITGQCETYTLSTSTPVPINQSLISAFIKAKDGRIWMVSSVGYLAYFSPTEKQVQLKIGNGPIEGSGSIPSLDEDMNGNIWIAYKGVGIYRYAPNSKQWSFWNEPDGLPGNRIQRLTTDKQGRVWAAIYNKISVYNPSANTFFNFKIPYSESNYAYVSYLGRSASGNLFGAINNEVFDFFPDRLFIKPVLRKPYISQAYASGKEVNLFKKEKVYFSPEENTLRIFFGSDINSETFPYDLEYKLEGVEQGWTVAGDKHEAIYNNLPSGNFTFHVKVKGKNNIWQTEEAAFNFTINTPFYKTKWFLISAALLICGFLFFLYRYRLHQKEKLMLLENKAQSLEKEKAMVMYENLKQQLNPHFLFNSLTSLNSLITLEPKTASEFLDSLSKTYRYILKSRDNETVPLIDEIRFAENYVKLQKTRFEKGFDVSITIPEEYYHHKIVPVTLQNLIENAIKHNIIDEDSPLMVAIYTDNGALVVKNNLQKKKFVETSNRQGLASMQSLYDYLSNHPVEIYETEHSFIVKIPLL